MGQPRPELSGNGIRTRVALHRVRHRWSYDALYQRNTAIFIRACNQIRHAQVHAAQQAIRQFRRQRPDAFQDIVDMWLGNTD